MEHAFKDKINKLIGLGKVKQAIEYVYEYSIDKEDCLLLQSKFSQNIEDFYRGVISTEDYRTENNRIIIALIRLLEHKENFKISKISIEDEISEIEFSKYSLAERIVIYLMYEELIYLPYKANSIIENVSIETIGYLDKQFGKLFDIKDKKLSEVSFIYFKEVSNMLSQHINSDIDLKNKYIEIDKNIQIKLKVLNSEEPNELTDSYANDTVKDDKNNENLFDEIEQLLELSEFNKILNTINSNNNLKNSSKGIYYKVLAYHFLGNWENRDNEMKLLQRSYPECDELLSLKNILNIQL